MRILFWSERFWPSIGGTQIFAARLLPALQERGYEFAVVTLQDPPDLPPEDDYKGIPVYRFPFLTAVASRDVEQVMALRRHVMALKQTFAPALIHLHGVGLTNVFFQLETKNASVAPLLVTLAGELPHEEANRAFMARILHQADWVTGKADVVLAQAHQLEPKIIPHSSVIHNGLAVPAVLPEPLPIEAPRLLCLGRLSLQKGFDLALEAFALIARRFPQARLIVAGDGPERACLEHQVTELGLSETVEFIGWVVPNEVPALINTGTVVIMPSRREGFPSVALQAAMMARPLVATRVSGLSDIIVHQQTGLLVEPEDHIGLAEAISWVLEHPNKAQDMGRAARRRVQDVFRWEQCVDAYDSLYQKLIKPTHVQEKR